MSALRHVVIVGPGRAGLALGHALMQAEAVDGLTVCGRRPDPPAHPLFDQGTASYVFGLSSPEPETEAVFLAVPDTAVNEIAHAMAGQAGPPDGCAAFHLSGALSTGVLAPLHARGYAVGSFHPLQALAHPVTSAERLPGSYVAVTGAPQAVAVARRMTAALGAHIITVPEARRPLYHAAAVMASNFLPPLLDTACRLLERAGIPYDEALPALLPLVRGTLSNIEEGGLDASVTGPIARGDVETVDLHLRALDPADRKLYAMLGQQLVELAASRVPEEAREELEERFAREANR